MTDTIEAQGGTSAAAEKPRPTLQEFARTLTGFEELAVQQKFGAEITELSETRIARACVFVMLRREQTDDKTAFGEVMRMTFGEIRDRFRITTEEDGDAAGEG